MTADISDSGASPLLCIRELRSAHAGPFSCELHAGECVTVSGPSGSGKSVFLRMISDLDPNQGEVTLDARRRETWPAPEWRRQVVYQAAEPAWWAPTAGAHFNAADRQSVTQQMERLALDPALLDADIGRLSTGERQRLALLRSLACRPRVLLLDEPTSALDQESILAVETLLRAAVHAGLAIVLVTHAQQQAERLGDRHWTIRKGRLVHR